MRFFSVYTGLDQTGFSRGRRVGTRFFRVWDTLAKTLVY